MQKTELIRYVDGICNKMKGKPGDINDFREEMLDHLRTSVKELQAAGYSEESAIREELDDSESSHMSSKSWPD
ncbi:permease prefix domain 1-containing protein [Paenibacillus mendelii]|uniref:Permease prefix domain 1-containing protein n=1 Tax=Paenibacillus mendelii TaxID=206163 RepID=A0ABV6J7C9_9BACL|nr:permease prefix domain 1-containing protein [Paenibacillus mendelii]